MLAGEKSSVATRRDLLSGGVLLSAATLIGASSLPSEAKDYTSRLEALDDLDRLAAACGMRLGMLRASRRSAEALVTRFLADLRRYQTQRNEARRRFGLGRGLDPSTQIGTVDGDLPGLRQALDDLMIAYAETLPVLGDSALVSAFAIDMVDVSRMRTVIDLWVEAEGA